MHYSDVFMDAANRAQSMRLLVSFFLGLGVIVLTENRLTQHDDQ